MIEERILSLAYTPANRNQITDWAPFGGNTLAEIVNQHNKELKQIWVDNGFSPDEINQFLEIIDIVRHDLNGVDKLVDRDYNSILIILADLDIDMFQKNQNELNWVRNGIAKVPSRVKHYLTQTGQKNDPHRLIDFFKGRVHPYPIKPPHVLKSQIDFERFLRYLHIPPDPLPVTTGSGLGDGGLDKLFPPQSGEDRKNFGPEEKRKEYLSARAKVKDDVRAAAMENELSEAEVRAVARLATQQELVLRDIKRTVSQSIQEHIVTDALRTPILSIATNPFQQPSYDLVELLHIRPVGAFEDISFTQRNALRQLGIMRPDCAAVSINTPETQDLLKSLGGNISVGSITANLPIFKTRT